MKFWNYILLDAGRWLSDDREPASVLKMVKVYLSSPGFRFLLSYRVLAKMFGAGGPLKVLAIFFWAGDCSKRGSEISLNAKIGPGLYTPHPYAIVVGDCIIGSWVTLQQSITIGNVRRSDGSVPIIGDDCFIGSGAVVLGSVSVGVGAKVGANAVVVKDVPPGATAVGVPATTL